ncbi:MAG: hypothetical protein JWO98_4868 [Frankiales bacterium]|nr:hypothetical protein [Frankiales bacterium]
MRAAIAVVTAASLDAPAVPVEELLADTDPLDVLAIIARALHLTLGFAVGDVGRAAVLNRLGIDAAGDES